MQAFAPLAASRAAAVGAYREAAAQYARALRFGAGLSPGERAALLEGRSRACYLADDQAEAIEVIREAIEVRRAEGAPERQARALAELSSYLFCRGFLTEGHEAIAEATDLVACRPDGRELAWVLHAQARFADDATDETLGLAREALAVAERCGDEEIIAEAKVTLGRLELSVDFDSGKRSLDRIIDEREAPGAVRRRSRARSTGWGCLSRALRPPGSRARLHDRTLAYCESRNLDLWRINVLAHMAVAALEDGRWTEAADAATRVLEDPRDSPWPHAQALLVLALVRARRGDPDARVPLDEALRLDIPPDEVEAHDDRAAAHAEIAWLERRLDEIDAATAGCLSAALRETTTERSTGSSSGVASPGSRPRRPVRRGPLRTLPCRSVGGSGRRMGAPRATVRGGARARGDGQGGGASTGPRRPSATRRTPGSAARVTAAAGARRPRACPRAEASTRESPAGLTARELDVLALLADGLRTPDRRAIVISPRTVDHHVSAILRKLEASREARPWRGQASSGSSRPEAGAPSRNR